MISLYVIGFSVAAVVGLYCFIIVSADVDDHSAASVILEMVG